MPDHAPDAPGPFADDVADDVADVFKTVSQKIPRGADRAKYTGTGITEEKRDEIERLLREGTGIVRVAHLTSSSHNTVYRVRDQLVEREPDLFRKHLASNLQRIANKAAARIEQGLDAMEVDGVKPSAIPGLSVSMGIVVDKLAILSGDTPTTVVEHRLKIDSDAVAALIQSQQRGRQEKSVEAEVVEISDSRSTH